MQRYLLFFLVGLFATVVPAQERVLVHSHNDYKQRVPFYLAYSQQVFSIEADVFLDDGGNLLVGHEPEELREDFTLKNTYIEPLVKIFETNKGKPWKDSDKKLQLVIELKNDYQSSLPKVVESISQYPEVFDENKNKNAVRVVITGKVPKPSEFDDYPDMIFFDGNMGETYLENELKRVAMISEPFFEYADWNGKGTLTTAQKSKVQEVIDKVHEMGKPIRFWGTPEGITAWNTFHRMGVDIINTDQLEETVSFFENFENKNYRIKKGVGPASGKVANYDKLDKVTSRFKGFDPNEIQLSEGIDVYRPKYLVEEKSVEVKNIILLIGDGMGLAQINAGEAANPQGLSLLNIRNIGLSITTPRGAFTVESASGGSAIATGRATDNRHISMTEEGDVVPAITDYTKAKGLANGVITLGNLADATPAVFYGHATDRDFSDEITSYLPNGKLDLLVGSGMHELTERDDGIDLIKELNKKYTVTNDFKEIETAGGKLIVADARFDLATTQSTIGLLAESTRLGIEKLRTMSDQGFFLMVEGAKIDYAGHSNSLPGTIVEMLSFDLAIAEALKFADEDGETLVIVTADHETGGLTLIDGDRESGLVTGVFVTEDHSPVMVPVFAYGPGSDKFRGVYQQKEIFDKMFQLLRLSKNVE